MSIEDEELLGDFVVEANEHLGDIENQFLAIEECGADIDVDLVNEVFRGIHSIKGAAGFLGLTIVNNLSHSLENVLNKMRNGELAANGEIVDAMLKAADALQGLIDDIENSNDVDVTAHIIVLDQIAEDSEESPPAEETAVEAEEAPVVMETPEIPEVEEVVTEEILAAALPEPAPTPAPVAPAPKASAKSADSEEKAAKKVAPEANIRVPVGVLDSLMNLAGELVLSRNQLLQAISSEGYSGLDSISSRLDQVTSELQESVMQTRMQQIGSVFGRFPRVVRDLATKLGKQCELVIEGKETEVDKTIVEAIGDPLTHLVRNSMDHGIESPEDRVANGKPAAGTLSLRACYQAGKVRIEIVDDGGGIDPEKLKKKAVEKGVITSEKAEHMSDREAVRLIFAPGFSMAAKVTDVSGRGVGMDVVCTNIARLGGSVDVESTLGVGTSVIVTLPLTLAIIPSLIVQVGKERFAIPQVNIAELVRVRKSETTTKLGRVKDAEVLRLRGNLLPLIRLHKSLSIEPCEEQEFTKNKRGATNIIVVDSGQSRFGLVVDSLHESEEIVVKPLGAHNQAVGCLSGATILGDGHVALILDIAGIAADESIRSLDQEGNADANGSGDSEQCNEFQSVILFSNHPDEQFAVPMDIISRIERVRADQIDSIGGQAVLQYKHATLPLLRLEKLITARDPDEIPHIYVVVYEIGGREIGLVVPVLKDINTVRIDVDELTFREPGVLGSLVLDENTVRMIDLFELTEVAHPEWFEEREAARESRGHDPHILLAEDSTFFRNQVQKLLESKGYVVEGCEDGLEAWQKLSSGEYDFDIVVTDIEMPNMNGFELCQKVKESPQWKHLPVIALTSLAAAADMQRGIDVGVDDYQIKMDKDKLLIALKNFVDHEKKVGSESSASGKKLKSTKSNQRQLAGSVS